MNLVTLRNVSLSFGGPNLLEEASLHVAPGERICVIGRNGEGKSTLLKLVSGELLPEQGEVERATGLIVATMGQALPESSAGSLYDFVAEGLGAAAELIKQFHHASMALAAGADGASLNRLERIQERLEAIGGWQLQQRVESVLSRMGLPSDEAFAVQSVGIKRRALLGRALVSEPDLLLLDEPTNHLDMDTIAFLEQFFLSWKGSLLFITHDRAFLRRLATRIVELDRGMLTDWSADYDNYLRRKAERQNAEAKALARFQKKLSQEEEWIRQGIKARRTRNEGRVRALQQLRLEARALRQQQGTARLQMQQAERSGNLLAEVENLCFDYQGKPLIKGLTTQIIRRDRIGICGPNGVGKSTLIRLLLGQLQPDSGSVKVGSGWQLAYFDQTGEDLDADATLVEAIGAGSDRVTINGQSRHCIGYLQDFLFTPQRSRQPVRALSGGERARLLLARLFTRPFNLLVLDEPTNDLDIETLELLEERLLEYEGTLLVVSHDRQFLDNVVTSLLVFRGEGEVEPFLGSYSDWLAYQQRRQSAQPFADTLVEESAKPAQGRRARSSAPKLSYKDQRELEGLPQQIEEQEEECDRLRALLSDPDFYREAESARVAEVTQALKDAEGALELIYQRWELLEAINNEVNSS